MSYRVVQWATGNQGVEAIRAVLDRPDLELVGAKVYGAEKTGLDAGVLAGRGACGVTATRDIDEILALGADCVAYFPRHASLDEVCRILASGANVTTTAFLFHPRSLSPADLARLEAACTEGDSSVHGTGLNPGNLSGVLPLALSGMSRSIERVTLQERADWSFYQPWRAFAPQAQGGTKSGSGSKNRRAIASMVTEYNVHSRASPAGPVGRSR